MAALALYNAGIHETTAREAELRIAALREKLPHFNFAAFEKDPQLSKVAEIFTVDAVVKFVERKLGK